MEDLKKMIEIFGLKIDLGLIGSNDDGEEDIVCSSGAVKCVVVATKCGGDCADGGAATPCEAS